MAALTHGDAQHLLATIKQSWERREPDLIVERLAEDIDYRHDPFEEVIVGRNEVHALLSELAASRAHVEFDVERVWVSGSTALASWHAAYTLRASAQRFRTRGFVAIDVNADGLVQRYRQWSAERVVGSDATFRAEDRDD